jgi:hypothetical protein
MPARSSPYRGEVHGPEQSRRSPSDRRAAEALPASCPDCAGRPAGCWSHRWMWSGVHPFSTWPRDVVCDRGRRHLLHEPPSAKSRQQIRRAHPAEPIDDCPVNWRSPVHHHDSDRRADAVRTIAPDPDQASTDRNDELAIKITATARRSSRPSTPTSPTSSLSNSSRTGPSRR